MGEPLDREDVRRLIARPVEAQRMADALRAEAVGDDVTFVVNRNINFTDVCINTCRFCAFANREGYLRSAEDVAEEARCAAEGGATEVCIQGGLHPDLFFEHYLAIVRAVRKAAPNIHIHAFSPQEVVHAARQSGEDIEVVLRELHRAGLGSMPGTAAEMLVDYIRKDVCPEKLGTAEWLNVIRSAHEQGIPTTCTMLYGIGEGWDERLEHLYLLRDLQSKTGGFTEFVPLSFIYPNTPLFRERGIKSPGIAADLLMVAVARLVLHPLIPNIQVSWVKLGQGTAIKALDWGANDLGGTLGAENITRLAGGRNGQTMSAESLAALARGAGRRPIRRDTLYRHLSVVESSS
ncbi:MAG: 5-amino-6-(D-ribitylamino)uracil--L-tyrosine 4-hydroxyphenyl transferase CofH [Methanopyri archaeon]|nr:5-amino-6-(D-ribitylamino)uracil--L-tyrosine 4-hydroxyphenyl transferase CofH [Methanopyri archaeon]